MAQECVTRAKTLNQSGGTEGMWPNPHWHPTTTANSRLQHSLPDPKPNQPYSKWHKRKDDQRSLLSLSLILTLLLILCATLIDLGAQVSSMNSEFCKELALQIQPLGQLLELEGTGVQPSHTLGHGGQPPDPGISNYNEDVLLLVIPTMTYSKTVPVMVGSKII